MSANLEVWVEKYRPQDFEDIVSQNIAINNLKDFVKTGEMPHMIFTGPAGTGKTSAALIVAKKLLKEENYYRNLLELNASDTVRMSYVRDVLKDFVNQNMIIGGNSLKIVILDEADNIPNQVQQALRRIIEKSSDRVKFILICNYISKIIDPIISRCAVFRFVQLPKDKIIDRLKYIVKKENLKIPDPMTDEFYEALFFISGGDLRKAINTLQSAVALELVENLDLNELLKISGFVDRSTLKALTDAIQAKQLNKSFEVLKSIENFDSRNFIRQILTILPELKITEKDKSKLFAFLGDIDYRISQGADEQIQLFALLANIYDMTRK
jgi:replication factor C small subunit